ncbi:MAG: carbohydrate porin, partial [Caulobacteraceae bacterium]
MTGETSRRGGGTMAALVALLWAANAMAQEAAPPGASIPLAATPSEIAAIHFQSTIIEQGYPAFAAPYSGPNSLPPGGEGRETFDFTLYGGVAPWRGAQIWINPEIDQGFGLHDTTGVAGFTNGDGAKVGKSNPYMRLQRLFLRQTFDLGGEVSTVDADLNQLAGAQTADRLVLTLGKFNATDIFDTNTYAHDSKHDFLNWSLVDAGTFDYAADAWGYTVGGAAELYRGDWVGRFGLFALSVVPNGEDLDPSFGEFQIDGEVARDFKIAGRDGALKITGFLSRGRMASFVDAIALALATHMPADVSVVRRYQGRGGISLNLQQQLTEAIGVFARAGFDAGSVEPYEYADIDRTVSAGISVSGKAWGRPGDRF